MEGNGQRKYLILSPQGRGNKERYAHCQFYRHFSQDLSAFNPANAFKAEVAGEQNGEKTSNGVQAEVSAERARAREPCR